MSEPEELITDAARHATVFARDLWRRHRRGERGAASRDTFADVAARVDLLITAVFGSGLPIRPAQPPAHTTLLRRAFGRDRGPRIRSAVPATDGAHIWLPRQLGLHDQALTAVCYRAMALQQAMRARRGSAELARSASSGLLDDIYLLLEAYSADEALAALLPGAASSIDVLRRTALERRPAVDAFPHARRPIERLARSLLEQRCGRPTTPALVTAVPADSLPLAARLAAQLSHGHERRLGAEPLLKDLWTGELRLPGGLAAGSEALLPEAGAADDRPERVRRTGRLRRPPKPRAAAEGEDDEQHEPGVFMVQTDDPHPHAEDPMGLRRPADRDEEASVEQLADMVADLPEARMIASPAPPKEVLLSDDPPTARAKRSTEPDAQQSGAIRYPEWDYRTQSYRERGAAVWASLAEPGSAEWVRATLAEHGATLHAIRRRFEMLRARPVRLRRQLDGHDVDLDSCIERAADLRAGRPASEGLYELRRARDRDLAALLLIDVSGSTDGWIAAHRRVIDVEREALLLVAVALESLGVSYAIEAFSGEGPERVTLRAVKRFEESYGPDVALRIAGLEPENYTRAGAAIRHASASLMRRPAAHRLLLLLSDGKPNDVDEYEGRYGAEDMRQAVIEAKLQGIFTFCLTIDRHAAGYLPRVFGRNQYALLTEPQRLPTVLLDWVKRLIVA